MAVFSYHKKSILAKPVLENNSTKLAVRDTFNLNDFVTYSGAFHKYCFVLIISQAMISYTVQIPMS